MTSSRAPHFAALFTLLGSTVGGCIIERGSLGGDEVDAFSPFDTREDVHVARDTGTDAPLGPEDDVGADAPITPTGDLIAHWEFEDTASFLQDSTPNNHTLMRLGGDARARSNASQLEFRGTPGLSTPNAADLNGVVTVSLWVIPNIAPEAGESFPVLESTDRLSVRYRAPEGATPRVYECARGAAQVRSTDVLGDMWTHVACVERAGQIELFVNGVLSGSAPSPAVAPSTSGYFLGADPAGVSSALTRNGRMDDVRLWRVAPSAADILALFTTTTPR